MAAYGDSNDTADLFGNKTVEVPAMKGVELLLPVAAEVGFGLALKRSNIYFPPISN
jgi:hypothetical protein